MAKKKKKPATKNSTAKSTAKKTAKKAVKKAIKKAAPKKKAAKKAAKKAVKKTVKKAKKVVKKTAKKAAPKKTTLKKAIKNAVKSAQKAVKKVIKKASAPKAPATLRAMPQPEAPTVNPNLGQVVPNVTLPDENEQAVNLAETLSGTSVLYFYPKDDTPGCTVEACSFRDNMNRLQGLGVKVFGVSPDDAVSHRKFIEKYGLNFSLLTDSEHKLADAFGVWKQKSFMGKTYMGVERSTFLFKDGKVVKAWQPVKVEGHVDEVVGALQGLGS